MLSRTLLLFLLGCNQTSPNPDSSDETNEPEELEEPNEDTTDDSSPDDPDAPYEHTLRGTWDEQGSLSLTTGDSHHNSVQLDVDGNWTSADGARPVGDLMVHQSYQGRYGTIARIEPINGTTLCQYPGAAAQMTDITGSRCGLARLECEPVDAIYLDHIFYDDYPDEDFINALLRDLEFNAYRIIDGDGLAFEMIVHDRGFANATDPWTPGEVTVDIEVLALHAQ